MFYFMALMILFSILAEVVIIYSGNFPDDNKIDVSSVEPLGSLSICCSIHCISYVGLILLMICTIGQITTGLKVYYYHKEPNRVRRARHSLCFLYLFCLFFFSTTVAMEVLSLAGD